MFSLPFFGLILGGTIFFVICLCFPVLFVTVIFTVWLDNIQEKEFLSSSPYLAWKATTAEMGLREVETKISDTATPSKSRRPILGTYRHHSIRIFQTETDSGGPSGESGPPSTRYTNYEILLEKPTVIELHLRKHDVPFGRKTDILVDDPVFDRRFDVTGTKAMDIRVLHDPSLRSQILKLGKFSLMNVQTNTLHYQFSNEIKNIKTDAVRFKDLINTMLDIVEKIESYPSSM